MCIHTQGLGLGKEREGGRERCGVHDAFLRHGKSAYARAKVGMIRIRGGGSVCVRERGGGGGG